MNEEERYYDDIEVEEIDDIEEGEEETFTLDFDKGVAIKQEVIVGENIIPKEDKEVVYVEPERTFKDDLSDLFIDTLTSKAIGSLIQKQRRLELETHEAMVRYTDGKMGALGPMLENETFKPMEKYLKELKGAYGYSGNVHYDRIPDWAKGYIKDYITNFVRTTADFLLEDE